MENTKRESSRFIANRNSFIEWTLKCNTLKSAKFSLYIWNKKNKHMHPYTHVHTQKKHGREKKQSASFEFQKRVKWNTCLQSGERKKKPQQKMPRSLCHSKQSKAYEMHTRRWRRKKNQERTGSGKNFIYLSMIETCSRPTDRMNEQKFSRKKKCEEEEHNEKKNKQRHSFNYLIEFTNIAK